MTRNPQPQKGRSVLVFDEVISETCVLKPRVWRSLWRVIIPFISNPTSAAPNVVLLGRMLPPDGRLAIRLCLGTWFLLNLIASFSGLKSRVASKQGQHQFNLITLRCGLPSRPVATEGPHGAPARDEPSSPGGHRLRVRAPTPRLPPTPLVSGTGL